MQNSRSLDEMPGPNTVVMEPNDRLVTSLCASVIASLATLNFGFAMGYSSPTEADLTTDKGHILNASEFAWFGSIVALGAIVGSILGGYCVQIFGRKVTIMGTVLFYTPGWCLICYANSAGMLYAGRLISGCGVGMAALSVPMYISEISSSRYRGALGCINQLAISFGALFVYSVGSYVAWNWLAVIPVGTSAISLFFMAFMPETPVWLLSKGLKGTALMSLVWLRGNRHDSSAELNEIETNLDNEEKLSISDFAEPGLYRPLIIGCMLMFFQQFVGINVILFYCANIFKTAGINWNAQILTGSVLFIFTIVACLFVDKFGRRVLLLIGSVAMFVCMFLMGVYYDLVKSSNSISIFGKNISHTVPLDKISWLSVTCVLLYIAFFAIGWGPLPWVLMGELFPPKARGQASSIVTIVNLLFTFVITRTFDSFEEIFHEQGAFWFYAGFCLLSFVYTIFFVPETKGKTLEEIQREFNRGSTQIRTS